MQRISVLIALIFYGITCYAQQIANMEGRRFEYPALGWHGNIEFGANFTKIENSIAQLTNRFVLIHHNKNRNILISNDLNFVSVNNQNIMNSAFQHIRYIQFGDSVVFPEAFVQTQYNKQLALNLRLLSGAGLRFRIYRDEKSFFYVGNVLMFEHEEYPDLPSQNDIRMSSYASIDISEWDYLPITFIAYLQPKLTDINDYRVSLEANLLFKSTKKFIFKTQARYVYDAFPPPGINPVFSGLTNTLVYTF
ncbi:MAG: DUF481 domain-containing protein [Bacteroidia bacterium]|nr:DUF481 domain-containing protein [Bacteroidia bacterium]MCC7532652.1 DUF481 domain-containing protein [Bacteroidia bacterium]MCZ2141694.1 DUF481 domain-containing protein [Bacteroidia bacterium]